ncbi:MAG: ribosome recycling factor [bacterium]|nr:ribosome recycling factor [Gammaproteobacteria bacterium]HIL98546.1 ribosome recycling factor [Pseudomonadales bacterium]
MLEEIRKDAEERMKKSLASLGTAFAKIRTGKAHPRILDGILVDYYGNNTPLNQVANITIEDARTLAIVPWEKPMIPVVEKAILKSDLGLNPSTSGDKIRLPMPPLTEENRRDLARIAKHEAENARVAIRNIRRDANSDMKDLLKEKEISEDEERRAIDVMQKLTDANIKEVENTLVAKEADLMEI